MEQVTCEVATRLFEEARAFISGRTPYLSTDSEIREIAMQVFGKQMTMHLNQVCYQIFYVLACEFMDVSI